MVLRVVFDRLAPLLSSCRGRGLFAFDRVFPAAAFAAIWGRWFFFYLLYYPGCTSVDSNDILKMVLGLPFEADHFRCDTWNNHHPVAYTALVSLFVNLGASIGGLSFGVGLFSLLQMTVLACCAAYGACWMRKRSGYAWVGVAAAVLRLESADRTICGYPMEGRAVCGGDAVLLLEPV